MKLILRNSSLVFQTGHFLESNPYKNAYPDAFRDKTVNTYSSIYGYGYFGFMCSGIRIRTTLIGDTINIYHGNTIIKTYEYKVANEYVNIAFESPVKVTQENPIKVRGAFWYANQTDWPILDNIDNFIGSPGSNSPIYVDFWFIKSN